MVPGNVGEKQHAATRCNTLQHAATRCNTLQHPATICNTLHQSATHLVMLASRLVRMHGCWLLLELSPVTVMRT